LRIKKSTPRHREKVVGALSFNLKMIASALPFIALSAIYFLKYRKQPPKRDGS
jgi:hypothetical protein